MNPAVLALQEALWDLGISPGARDGRWGPATRSALRRAAAFERMAASTDSPAPDADRGMPRPVPAAVERYGIEDLLDAARTVYGEARGESDEGKRAVAYVIANRAQSYPPDRGKSLAEICRRRAQFSCWNEGDPNRARVQGMRLDDMHLCACLIAVVEALSAADDPTRGATHYHTRSIAPSWAQGKVPCYTCGGHLFYNNVA
ncbi:MAG: cell wall hydrolase [Gammaproteobacteria bacterium]